MNISPEMYVWTKKNRLDFGSHHHLTPDLATFWRILQHCEMEHFSTNWFVSREKWSVLHKDFAFALRVSLDKIVPINFWISSGSQVLIWTTDEDTGLPWWRSTLSKCSCYSCSHRYCYHLHLTVRIFLSLSSKACIISSGQSKEEHTGV